MKRILPLVALVALFITSCSNPDDPNPVFKSRGLITGADMRLCASPCCGGWFIEIDGRQYRFSELPPNNNVDLIIEALPIPVLLSWSRAGNGDACMDDIITIYAITKE